MENKGNFELDNLPFNSNKSLSQIQIFTLSISIVIYRNYEDVLNALYSIENHSNPELIKIIYLIDNSDFATTENVEKSKCDDFKKKIKQFKYVNYIYTGSNIGFGKGHNFVINMLNSKYHAIVNPDILLVDDAFDNLINYMNNNESVGMAIPKIVDSNGNIQKVYRRELTKRDIFLRVFAKIGFKRAKARHTMQDMDYTKPFQVPFGQGSFLLIRTKLFKELNGFDERYFMYMEDADLCKRVNSVSKVMYCPYATVIHKWKKESHTNFKLLLVHINSMNLYFKKWQ